MAESQSINSIFDDTLFKNFLKENKEKAFRARTPILKNGFGICYYLYDENTNCYIICYGKDDCMSNYFSFKVDGEIILVSSPFLGNKFIELIEFPELYKMLCLMFPFEEMIKEPVE